MNERASERASGKRDEAAGNRGNEKRVRRGRGDEQQDAASVAALPLPPRLAA